MNKSPKHFIKFAIHNIIYIMSNLKLNLNLSKIDGVQVLDAVVKPGKTGDNVVYAKLPANAVPADYEGRIVVIPAALADLFVSDKGQAFLNLAMYETPGGQYGEYRVSQSFSKDGYAAWKEMHKGEKYPAILGNAKIDTYQAQPAQQSGPVQQLSDAIGGAKAQVVSNNDECPF